MAKIFSKSIDIKNGYIDVLQGIVQNDDARLRLFISDSGKPVNLGGVNVIRISVKKPDYETIETIEIKETIQEIDTENGIVDFIIPRELVSSEGVHQLQLSFYKEKRSFLSARLNYVVSESISGSDEASPEHIKTVGDILQVVSESLSGESLRIINEDIREAAETERKSAENLRTENETLRSDAEKNRALEENNRSTAEKSRAEGENARVENENNRVEAETERQAAEESRAEAENSRIEAENDRAEGYEKIVEKTTVNNVYIDVDVSYAVHDIYHEDKVIFLSELKELIAEGKNIVYTMRIYGYPYKNKVLKMSYPIELYDNEENKLVFLRHFGQSYYTISFDLENKTDKMTYKDLQIKENILTQKRDTDTLQSMYQDYPENSDNLKYPSVYLTGYSIEKAIEKTKYIAIKAYATVAEDNDELTFRKVITDDNILSELRSEVSAGRRIVIILFVCPEEYFSENSESNPYYRYYILPLVRYRYGYDYDYIFEAVCDDGKKNITVSIDGYTGRAEMAVSETDDVPTENSDKLITSGAVYKALESFVTREEAEQAIENINKSVSDLPSKLFVEEQITEALKGVGTSNFVVTANITIGEDLFSGAYARVSNVSASYEDIKEAYENEKNIILVASEDETTYIFELESVEIETFSFITLCKVTKGYAILNVKITADGENTTIVILKENNAVSQEVTYDVMTEYVNNAIGDVETALENIVKKYGLGGDAQ